MVVEMGFGERKRDACARSIGVHGIVESVRYPEGITSLSPAAGTRCAVSIDERPLLLLPKLDVFGRTNAKQDVKNAWFAGNYFDVGGALPQMKPASLKPVFILLISETGLRNLRRDQFPDYPRRIQPE